MNRKSINALVVTKILAVVFILASSTLAQRPPMKLAVQTPFDDEIAVGNGRPAFYVDLKENQTAVFEVEQKGIELNFGLYDPNRRLYAELRKPVGRFSKERIFLTSKKAGYHQVQVRTDSVADRSAKFTITLLGVRETLASDIRHNKLEIELVSLYKEINRAEAAGTIDEKIAAIEKARKIVELSTEKQDRIWEAVGWQKVGRMYLILGQLQKALDGYTKSLEIGRELKHRDLEKNNLTGIGIVWTNAANYRKALSFSQQALKIAVEHKDAAAQILNLYNISIAFGYLKYPKRTINIVEKSLLPTVKALNLKPLEPSLYSTLGQAYIDSGNYQKGIEMMQKGVDLGKNSDSTLDYINLNLSMGKAYLEKEKNEESFKSLTEAITLAEKIGYRKSFVEISYKLAVVERRRGNSEKSLKILEKAINVAEGLRRNFTNQDLQTSYFANVQSNYELYVDLLIERGEKLNDPADIFRAFEFSERSRSRNLIDLLQEARIDFKRKVNPELLQKQKNLIDELNLNLSARQSLYQTKPKQAELDKLSATINDLELELGSLNSQIRKENLQYIDLTEGKTLTTKEIQDLLDEETILLEYKLGEKRSFVWLVTKGSIEVFKLPKRELIEQKARVFYESVVANKLEDMEKVAGMSKDLSELLFGSFADKLKGKRLAIVSEGVLQYLPFSALISSNPDESNYLVDQNEIVVLPSASVLAQIRNNTANAGKSRKTLAVFADPVFDSQDSRISKNNAEKPDNKSLAIKAILRDFRLGEKLPRLLASRQEARNIAGFVADKNETVRLGFDANLGNIENANLFDYQIIHFATHGLLNTKQPELSGLVFSLYDEKGISQDGFLSLNDIYNLNLNSDMIVLSACQTALGKDVRGEGLIGISRGFLYAGSNRIVASLWKVDDSATAEFMKRFYKNHLQKGMPASKALQQTKIEMKKIKRYKSPYYWSAFTLLGDWK